MEDITIYIIAISFVATLFRSTFGFGESLIAVLHFDQQAIGIMIALYIAIIAIYSFGTACNVTGDVAIAVIVNKIFKSEIQNN